MDPRNTHTTPWIFTRWPQLRNQSFSIFPLPAIRWMRNRAGKQKKWTWATAMRTQQDEMFLPHSKGLVSGILVILLGLQKYLFRSVTFSTAPCFSLFGVFFEPLMLLLWLMDIYSLSFLAMCLFFSSSLAGCSFTPAENIS